MNDLAADQLLINLLSGLIGAIIGSIIGGLLSYWGSWKVAKLQINAAKEIQEKQERVLFDRKMASLLAEIMDNLDRAEQLNIEGYRAWMRYLRDIWDEAKGDLFELPEKVQMNLIKAYTEIAKYNTLVDNQLADPRDGFQSAWDGVLKSQGEQVKKELSKAKRSLEKWLHNEPILDDQDS